MERFANLGKVLLVALLVVQLNIRDCSGSRVKPTTHQHKPFAIPPLDQEQFPLLSFGENQQAHPIEQEYLDLDNIRNVNSTSNPNTATVQDSSPSERCSCGRRNVATRIVGGTVAETNEFPWRCNIRVGRSFCGCTLISNEWVMTAAHCTFGTPVATVILGAHFRNESEQSITTIQSSRIVNHPGWNPSTIQNDISLIKLSQPIVPTREISPACLPFAMQTNQFAGSNAITSGWGSTYGQREANRRSNILRKLNMSVISNRECSQTYSYIYNDKICARGQGTICSGDSGGSLDVLRNGHHYAIGVTSFMYSANNVCFSNRPAGFARVTHFLNWIQQVTGEQFCRP